METMEGAGLAGLLLKPLGGLNWYGIAVFKSAAMYPSFVVSAGGGA